MIVEILFSILLGVALGIFTGLIPGIHVNLISALAVNLTSYSLGIPLFYVCIFIVCMATTHSFLDVIPSVFLGAPESATALGVLPGHRYLLKGNGLMAVKLTLVGSFGSLVLGSALFYVLLDVVSFIYPFIRNYIGYILLCIAVFMILRDNKKLWALFVFMLSGILGYTVFAIPNLKNPLFPLLSGLFGTATLLYSLKESEYIPKQNDLPFTQVKGAHLIKALCSGSFSGFITAVLPGIGAATAAILSMQFTRKLGDHGFMILMGAISTSNFVFSLVTFYALEKARNGALVSVHTLLGEITLAEAFIFLLCALISGSLALICALYIGKIFLRLFVFISYTKLITFVLLLIVVLTPILSGSIGIVILLSATGVGLIPAIVKTSRTQAMGCLLLPVLLYFLL